MTEVAEACIVEMASLDNAVRFLTDNQSLDGAWRDFDTGVGVSTSWTTGYILAALKEVADYGVKIDGGSVGRAIDFLRTTYVEGMGWGYNESVKSDADSTSWCILGIGSWNAELVRGYGGCLTRYIGNGGGFRTFIDLEASNAWKDEHADVTAVGIQALKLIGNQTNAIDRAITSVERHFVENGGVHAYWYTTDVYAELQCYKAAAAVGDRKRFDRMLQLADQSITSGENCAFRVASKLELQACKKGVVDPLLSEIWKLQASDGRWLSSSFLRVTNPDVERPWLDPVSSGPSFTDQNCLFSTATVSRAIVRARLAQGAYDEGLLRYPRGMNPKVQ